MRRFLILICLMSLAFPVAVNLAGCSSNKNANYCNGLGFGPKRSAVATINLEPKVTGLSLAYGQTTQLGAPSAFSCTPPSPINASFTYGSRNPSLVDVSPTGAVCGGTWNRASAGGIPDFTICTPPPGPGATFLNASAGGAASNDVPVFVHPPISSITIPNQSSCVSQGRTLTDASGKPLALSAGTVVLDQAGKQIDPRFVGNLTYAAVNPAIVSIDTAGVATAQNPGSTAITATLSQTSSATGYFYTCPPASISLTYADQSISKTVQQGTPQQLTAIVKDVNGVTLTGISLEFASTSPTQIGVDTSGLVTAAFPGSSAITAICQPASCNPSPVDQIGVKGNGKPIVSNSVQATAVGLSSTFLWISATGTRSFVPVDLTNGAVGAAVKLPYFPNSMVLNQGGNDLYFGSYRELMIYSTPLNSLSKEDINVPGVVLAAAPDNSTVVINDQVRKVIYIYSPAAATFTSFGGTATSAAYAPDSQTVYIAGPSNLYVFSAFTGLSTYDLSANGNQAVSSACLAANNLNNTYVPPGAPAPPYNPFCAPGVAITIPSVAAFLGGAQTTAHAFCPDTSNPRAPSYYPAALAGPVNAATDKLAATNDGRHILGAQANPPLFSDIGVSIPTGACPATNSGLTIPATLNQAVIPAIAPTSIHQVVADPDSTLAFITYDGTPLQGAGGLLPFYKVPAAGASGLGTIANIPLAGTAIAPLVGVFSPDNAIFFTGTSGDNFVHYIDTKTLTDSKQIDPKLLDGNGQPVAPQFLAVKPRPTT